MKSRKPLVIGIAGGSGSGKTSVTNSIFPRLMEEGVGVPLMVGLQCWRVT